MSPARRLSSVLQGGFFSKSRVPVMANSVRPPINVVLLGFCASIMATSTCQPKTRGWGIFVFDTLIPQVSRLFEETGIFRSKSHHLPPSKHPAECAQKRPSHHDQSPQPCSSLPQLEARGLGKVFHPSQPPNRAADQRVPSARIHGPRPIPTSHL